MDQRVISLEGDVNDQLPSFRHLIERLSPLRAAAHSDQVALDLGKLHYLGPDGVTMIAGSVLEAQQRGVLISVNPPVGSESLLAFFEFSGFNHVVLGENAPETKRQENVTVPLRQFHQSRHNDPDPIIRLIEQFEPVSEDLRLSLQTAVNECIQNIEDHSRSPIGGLGCARLMTGSREVRVALMDWGEGIFASLRRRYPDTRDDVHALERVLRGGYTAKTRANNLGRGIDNLRSVVTEAFGGNLYIVSGSGAVDIHGRRPPRYNRLEYPFCGTAVCYTLPLQPRN